MEGGGAGGGVQERWRAPTSCRHGRQVARRHSVAKSDIFIRCKQCVWGCGGRQVDFEMGCGRGEPWVAEPWFRTEGHFAGALYYRNE